MPQDHNRHRWMVKNGLSCGWLLEHAEKEKKGSPDCLLYTGAFPALRRLRSEPASSAAKTVKETRVGESGVERPEDRWQMSTWKILHLDRHRRLRMDSYVWLLLACQPRLDG